MSKGKMAGIHMSNMMDKPESSIRLEGAHAKAMAKAPMGKEAKIVVHGIKTRHVVNSDGSHSIEMRPKMVSPFNDDSKASGPHGKGSDNDQKDSVPV